MPSHTRYRFVTTIKRVEERSRAVRSYKVNPADPKSDTIVEREKLGWFVVLDGSWEALYVGKDKPELKEGEQVSVTIEPAPVMLTLE